MGHFAPRTFGEGYNPGNGASSAHQGVAAFESNAPHQTFVPSGGSSAVPSAVPDGGPSVAPRVLTRSLPPVPTGGGGSARGSSGLPYQDDDDPDIPYPTAAEIRASVEASNKRAAALGISKIVDNLSRFSRRFPFRKLFADHREELLQKIVDVLGGRYDFESMVQAIFKSLKRMRSDFAPLFAEGEDADLKPEIQVFIRMAAERSIGSHGMVGITAEARSQVKNLGWTIG